MKLSLIGSALVLLACSVSVVWADSISECLREANLPLDKKELTKMALAARMDVCVVEMKDRKLPAGEDLIGTATAKENAPYKIEMVSSEAGNYLYIETNSRTLAELRARARTLGGTLLGCEVKRAHAAEKSVKLSYCLFKHVAKGPPSAEDLGGSALAKSGAPYRVKGTTHSTAASNFVVIESFKKSETEIRARGAELGAEAVVCQTRYFQ